MLKTLKRWLRKLYRLPGKPPALKRPTYYVPIVSSSTPAQRRYLLERYGAVLHPEIRKKLQAQQYWHGQKSS
jgi:hypothetical protein